ncbi:DUF2164 domain-containing protein [Zoogloea sp.]|uniref:DUF2164 domain-containing protein n=1 Tax=Zoogloea sp. TaxID=49181 RepID=UPI002639E0AE|nr:DUF2164 domain-containing protein [Zoogloea sp.]
MAIALKKEIRDQLIQSIQRYFEEELDEKIGNIAAGGLLGFVLEEIGPVIYNKAVSDVQERLQIRIADLEFEVHEEELQYWKKHDQLRRR